MEYFPYRSSNNRYAHNSLDLWSQLYSRKLVLDAMKNDVTIIVIRYGKAHWFRDVRGLENYQHLLLLRGNQQTHISPTGFDDEDGFQKVVEEDKGQLGLQRTCDCLKFEAEQAVAFDRAAITVFRDTTSLQAARQVNCVGRPPEPRREDYMPIQIFVSHSSHDRDLVAKFSSHIGGSPSHCRRSGSLYVLSRIPASVWNPHEYGGLVVKLLRPA